MYGTDIFVMKRAYHPVYFQSWRDQAITIDYVFCPKCLRVKMSW